MKQFTISQFKKDGWTIPNLPDGITIEKGTPSSWHYTKVKVLATVAFIRDNGGPDLTHMLDSNQDDSLKITLINLNEENASFSDSNYEICHALGWITRACHDGGRGALDGLYHKYNPANYYFKNGNLKHGFWNTLRERLMGRANHSHATLTMMRKGIDLLKDKYPNFSNEQIQDLFYQKTWHNIHWCNYTSQWYPNFLLKNVRLNNEYKHIPMDLNLADFGFTKVEGRTWWLSPDYVIYNDRAYKRDELNLVRCPVCNNEVVEGDLVDGEMCNSCYDNKYKIHSYSTRVPTLLSFKAKNVRPKVEPIYLGLELEYETVNKDRAKKEVINLLDGHAILKSDGSIRNGFEIVTCPATADIHLDVFKSFFDNKPKDLKVADNVGMHIHISRKPLNTFTIGKMTEFLNRSDNARFITHVAGREPNQYCRLQNRTLTYPLYDKGDRYNALNLNPDSTVEIRIFSTPKDFQEFAQKVQFAQALTDYCGPAQLSCSLKELTKASTFTSWVLQHHKDYPELANHLKGI